ncbi:hypothetical protein F4803DRAFT_561949 [Xylaria telfairii]|nr:hypothetical protein F4803DRAFT_561949 [Xylaria telfairii]
MSNNEEDTASSSSSSSVSSTSEPIRFPLFTSLPPELRHHIWRLAVPSPGINFFNVHCFPNDHAGCNRSTSPPFAYLDLRRLAIEDSDATVGTYDPSAWQARHAIRQTCREARDICSIPSSKSAIITLTRPRRGLSVRAGDGQLRNTPLRYNPDSNTEPEPAVRRRVEVHVDDILCLSVENCSFNLLHEEGALFSDDDHEYTVDVNEGWAYDPQLTPKLPVQIPAGRLCAGMGWSYRPPPCFTTDALFGLLYSQTPGYQALRPGQSWPGRLLLLLDDMTREVGGPDLEDLTSTSEVVWDRFGDCYVKLPWHWGPSFPDMYSLTKVWPEKNDVRERYLRSGLLHSPKRPARPTDS